MSIVSPYPEELRRSAVAADSLAEDLGSGGLAAEGLAGRLETIIREDPEIVTVGVAYDPQAEEIVLLEYMYFIVYLAILATALHTFLFFSTVGLPIVRYRESLIVKLLFWPVVLGLALGIAVVVLY